MSDKMTLSRLQHWWKLPWVSLVLVLVVAALLRYPGLTSVPPGLSFDEAGNGVAAMDVANGQYRLWWPIGGGKEPLIVYLLQPLIGLFGPTSLALRLYAATMGVITVAGTYWLAWEMFVATPTSEREKKISRLLPLFAALGLATAFWHVAFSRVAFRALALPAVEVLAVAWLWRVLWISESVEEGATRSWLHFAGAGALIGLAAYTYLPGRFVPIVLILFFAAEAGLAWLRGVQPLIVRHIRGLAVSVLAALVVLLPLLVFFAQHPAAFFERAGVVSIFNPTWNEGDLGRALLRVTLSTFGTFAAITGDPNPIANLPGRPMLGLFLALFFWLGVAVSVWRVVRYAIGWTSELPSPPGRSASPTLSPRKSNRLLPAAHLLLLCWWLVMLLPGILAPEDAPHHLRIIGTAPVTYILVAVGLSQISNIKYQMPNLQICKSANLRKLCDAPFVRYAEWLVVLVFLIIGLTTARDYFGRWARLPELYMTYDVYALELIEQMASDRDPAAVYVIPMDSRAGNEARHYTLDFLYQGDTPYHYVPVDEMTIPARLTEVADGHKVLRVVRWLQDKHAGADEREVVTFLLTRAGQLVDEEIYPVYRIETWALPSAHTAFVLPTIEDEVGANFGDVLRLEAANLSVIGDTVAVALRWAPLAAMDADYKASLRLVAADGSLVAQKDRFLRHNWHQGTSLWPSETVNEYYLLPEVPPGQYELQVIVYHPETLAPLMVDGSGQISLGEVQVE
jgi:4-amino-4-deoxy-L-arabinose transferase-like glycosyltransferase